MGILSNESNKIKKTLEKRVTGNNWHKCERLREKWSELQRNGRHCV